MKGGGSRSPFPANDGDRGIGLRQQLNRRVPAEFILIAWKVVPSAASRRVSVRRDRCSALAV